MILAFWNASRVEDGSEEFMINIDMGWGITPVYCAACMSRNWGPDHRAEKERFQTRRLEAGKKQLHSTNEAADPYLRRRTLTIGTNAERGPKALIGTRRYKSCMPIMYKQPDTIYTEAAVPAICQTPYSALLNNHKYKLLCSNQDFP